MDSKDLALDVDLEVARAIHCVVRGFHDGECPKCHQLFNSKQMVWNWDRIGNPRSSHKCPNCHCGFEISKEEMDAAIALFGPIMDRNLEVFEVWRSDFHTRKQLRKENEEGAEEICKFALNNTHAPVSQEWVDDSNAAPLTMVEDDLDKTFGLPKISDVITYLSKMKEQHGDLPFYMTNGDMNSVLPVKTLDFIIEEEPIDKNGHLLPRGLVL